MNIELSDEPRSDPSVRMYAAAANRPTSALSPRAATVQVGIFVMMTASIWANAMGAEILSRARADSDVLPAAGSDAGRRFRMMIARIIVTVDPTDEPKTIMDALVHSAAIRTDMSAETRPLAIMIRPYGARACWRCRGP